MSGWPDEWEDDRRASLPPRHMLPRPATADMPNQQERFGLRGSSCCASCPLGGWTNQGCCAYLDYLAHLDEKRNAIAAREAAEKALRAELTPPRPSLFARLFKSTKENP
jgi:hypothetical protein